MSPALFLSCCGRRFVKNDSAFSPTLSAQFLEETPGDADLVQALEENKTVLVKKRHRVKALQYAISDLKSQRPHLAAPVATSASATASISAGGSFAPGFLYPGSAGVIGVGGSSITGARLVSLGAGAIAGSSDSNNAADTRAATARRPSNDSGVGDTISTMTASMALSAESEAPPSRAIPASTVIASDAPRDSGNACTADSGIPAHDSTALGQGAGEDAQGVEGGSVGDGGILL